MIDRTIPPVSHPYPLVELPVIRSMILDNGISLNVIDQGVNEVSRISLIRDGGTVEACRPTVATLMSGMLCEGTATYKGADLTDRLEFNGAWFNGVASRHHTAAVMYALNSKFADVAPLLLSMATEASFPQDRFDSLKERTISQVAIQRSRAKFRSLEALRAMVYGDNHPMSRVDTPQQVAAITLDDVKAYYGPGFVDKSLSIYLSGRITPGIEDTVNKLFGSIEVAQQTMAVDNSERVTCNDSLRTVQVDGSMQGSVRMAIPTIGPTHPDYCDLSLAVTALGGYFGSRLISNVREDKGYTYGIQAMMTGARDYGLMAIASEADNTYVIPLIQETISEIAQLQSKIASAEEIERMRNYAMSQIIALLDSPFSVMDYYEMMHCDNLPADMFHRNMKSIENITGERIAEVAAQYLQPDKIKIVVAGDVDTHPVHADDIFC